MSENNSVEIQLLNMQADQTQFVEGLKNGDRKVFQQIFDTYYEPLCRYCIQRIANQEDAEEIVQDIFVKLWTKRQELQIDLSLRAYLYRTALNRIINYGDHLKIRKIHHDYVLSGSNSIANQSDELLKQEIQLLAAEAVNAMPEKRREVYLLSRHDGLKYNEIAQRLDVSVKTVEAHLSKALEQMRVYLKDYIPAIALVATHMEIWLNF
jgi:RNA polymerase sigma-70 factor, ECF subfamily